MSRLADLAGYLPQTIVLGFKSVENTNEDTKPKAKSAPCAGWAKSYSFFLLLEERILFLISNPSINIIGGETKNNKVAKESRISGNFT